jgi:hypothetical protein
MNSKLFEKHAVKGRKFPYRLALKRYWKPLLGYVPDITTLRYCDILNGQMLWSLVPVQHGRLSFQLAGSHLGRWIRR